MTSSSKHTCQEMLKLADIRINGSRPWDMQVKNERLYDRILAEGSLGLGESYMDGWWECKQLDEFFNKLLAAHLDKKVKLNFSLVKDALLARLTNMQSVKRAFQVGEEHYDLGNDLYNEMLDKRLVYTCAYWDGVDTLDAAQEKKLDLVCRKIGLKKGMTVLDIGCGWGSFAKFAAKKYGAKVTGLTISREQAALARTNCKGLPVTIKLQDYRQETGKYDRIISLGMFEHVGYKNYRTYMQVAHRCLKDEGLFLLHTIGGAKTTTRTDPWIHKYIFPNGMLPSVKQISEASEGLFVMEDWHNFGVYYDLTLMAWYNNFKKGWPKLQHKYSARFYRMWKYYLLCCAGSFRSRRNNLWQIVFSKNGRPGGYRSIR